MFYSCVILIYFITYRVICTHSFNFQKTLNEDILTIYIYVIMLHLILSIYIICNTHFIVQNSFYTNFYVHVDKIVNWINLTNFKNFIIISIIISIVGICEQRHLIAFTFNIHCVNRKKY